MCAEYIHHASALAGMDCWDFTCACKSVTNAPSDAGAKAKCLLPGDAFDWQVALDTSQPVRKGGSEQWMTSGCWRVQARSLTVLTGE